MKKINLLMIICLMLSSCSFSNASKEEVSSRPSDELEFVVDSVDEPQKDESSIVVEEQKIVQTKSPDEEMAGSMPEKIDEVSPEIRKIAEVEGKAEVLVAPEEPKFENYQKEHNDVPEITANSLPAAQDFKLGAEEKYHVQKGDTLMMVAFKIYGDYRKWKDLKEWNKSKLVSKIGPGVVLKYYVPEQAFGWQPSGLPYLVKTGDNLGMISMEKYGTSKKWKNIYENNRPLIRDPNLIFAGFTIYYVPVRDVASEHR